MENVFVSRLMRLISSLSIENKLEILSKLSENLKVDISAKEDKKENLLNELFGSWSDVDDDLSNEILQART